MDVILDSNIYRSDFLLRSNDFDVLLDYLKRTNSSIYLPLIIIDEIRELHNRALKERLVLLNKSVNNLNLLLVDSTKRIPPNTFDEKLESELYIEFIKEKLKINRKQILLPKENYLAEVTRRATKREKPCGEDGQGFRDALIWLTAKDFCSQSKEQQITFISNNDKDFANSDKSDLHESLIKECDDLGIKINYFRTIRDFIEKHSVKIEFITDDWLTSNFDFDSFNETVIDDFNGRNSRPLADWLKRKSEQEPSGYYKVTSVNSHSISSFSVYEMIDGTYIVNVVVDCEIEVEFEYYVHEYNRRYADSGSYGLRTDFDNKDADIEIYASLTIKGDEIIDIEIDDVTF